MTWFDEAGTGLTGARPCCRPRPTWGGKTRGAPTPGRSACRAGLLSAVGIDVDGYAEAGSLAVIGCGAQGRMHAFLLAQRLSVSLYDRSPEVARALAADLPGFEVTVHAGARSAVAAAEIAVFTTTVDEGYVEPDWPRPGALLVNVSLGDLTDATFLEAAAVYRPAAPRDRSTPPWAACSPAGTRPAASWRRIFGAVPGAKDLLPGPDAHLAETTLADWLARDTRP